MNHFLLRRWLTGITLLMMVGVMAGYAGHQHRDAAHAQASVQCDLCVAFAATGGVPVAAVEPRIQRVAIGWLLPMPRDVADAFAIVRAHSPRAPPASPLTV